MYLNVLPMIAFANGLLMEYEKEYVKIDSEVWGLSDWAGGSFTEMRNRGWSGTGGVESSRTR